MHAPSDRRPTHAASPRTWRVLASIFLVCLSLAAWPRPAAASPVSVDFFDANPLYTGGVVLPLASARSGVLAGCTRRSVERVAADGATLLLLRARLPLGGGRDVVFELTAGKDGSAPGGLYPIDAQGLVDRSKAGGQVDAAKPGPRRLVVPGIVADGHREAWALYRSPRDFDGVTGATASQNSRTVGVTVTAPAVRGQRALTVVRPLVLLLHGTVNNPGDWSDLPLWKLGGNELAGYRIPADGVPFQVDRLSYQWISLADGPLDANGRTVVEQIQRCLENWRLQTKTAGTQVDVVTHSYGGPVARQAAQTQPDPNPLTIDSAHNFRCGENWGHGAYHKLLTLAGSHRGGAWVNTFAFLNHFGRKGPGAIRQRVCETTGIDIGAGAPSQEIVCSPQVMQLEAAFFPSHAFVGSGMLSVEGPKTYAAPLTYREFQTYDAEGGPYQAAGDATASARNANRLANFTFGLDYDSPALAADGTVIPNTDLIVGTRSGTGLLPPRAVTTVNDLDPSGALVGHLSHTEFIYSSASRKDPPNRLVSKRLAMLLAQPTTSRYFARFPANRKFPPDATERQFLTRRFKGELMYDPAYNLEGAACQSPPPFPNPKFAEVRVHPASLTLRGTTPSPLLVYGRKGDGWAFTQSLSGGIWCKMSVTSSDPSVVDLQVQPATGIPVPRARRPGRAVLTVTVEGTAGTRQVPVRVEGFPVRVIALETDARDSAPRVAMLATAGFDPRRLVRDSIRVNGRGTPQVDFRDVDGDGRPDAVLLALHARGDLEVTAAYAPSGNPRGTQAFVQGTVRLRP